MKADLNTFDFLVTDISGANYIPTGTWSISGNISDSIISTYDSITAISGSPGFYRVGLYTPIGLGNISLHNSDVSAFITPDFYTVEVTSSSVDDVYSKLVRYDIDQISLGIVGNYEQIAFTMKEADSIYIEYVAPSTTPNISGWTWKAQLRGDSALISGGAGLLGDLTVVVTDESTKAFLITGATTLTDNIIPSGSVSTTVYSDLQGTSPTGRRLTVAELTITVNREFTES